MMDRLLRLDRRIASVEGGVAAFVLLSMIVVAVVQAVLFNLVGREVDWASRALAQVDWADTYLQKGTLWLAFLGASLATHEDKHIAIDAFTKLFSERGARIARSLVSVLTGIVCLVLARVFYDAGVAADAGIPFDLEVLTPDGGRHVCDVARAAAGTVARPPLLCFARNVLGRIGLHANSGGGIAQMIVPVMFVVIGLRFILRAATGGHPGAQELLPQSIEDSASANR